MLVSSFKEFTWNCCEIVVGAPVQIPGGVIRVTQLFQRPAGAARLLTLRRLQLADGVIGVVHVVPGGEHLLGPLVARIVAVGFRSDYRSGGAHQLREQQPGHGVVVVRDVAAPRQREAGDQTLPTRHILVAKGTSTGGHIRQAAGCIVAAGAGPAAAGLLERQAGAQAVLIGTGHGVIRPGAVFGLQPAARHVTKHRAAHGVKQVGEAVEGVTDVRVVETKN